MKTDNIAYYSDEEIERWYRMFQNVPDNVNNLKDIPFNYHEVMREYYRREAIKAAKSDWQGH